MSQPGSRFLQLPRELRDEIYAHYLREETGYVHVAQTNKLQRADGRPIELALTYTCRLVAEEMRGLPLKVNAITFKSYCPEVVASEKEDVWSAWCIAGRYDYLLDRLWFAKEEALAVAASFYGTQQATEQLKELYPHSRIGEALERIGSLRNEDYVPLPAVMGSPRTMTYRDRIALQHALDCLSTLPEFPGRLRTYSHALYILGYEWVGDVRRAWATAMLSRDRAENARLRAGTLFSPGTTLEAEDLESSRVNHIASAVVTHTFLPWNLPTEKQLTELRRLFSCSEPGGWRYFNKKMPDLKYHLSAASQAIRFLSNLPDHQQKALRHIIVHEDRKSVAFPECHAQGLVPYLENLDRLRIERRADMWKTIFPSSSRDLVIMTRPVSGRFDQRWFECDIADAVFRFIPWILEATTLDSDSITARPESYSIYFEAPSDAIQTIWDKTKEIAALYHAAMACHKNGSHPSRKKSDLSIAFTEESQTSCDGELLVRSIQQILAGGSVVKLPCMLGTLDEFSEQSERSISSLEGKAVQKWDECRSEILEGVLECGDVSFKAVQSLYARYPDADEYL